MAALRFNTIVAGLTEPIARRARAPARVGPADLEPLRDLLARDVRALTATGDPWTDDHAPVEWLTDRMIISYAAEGGRLEEDFRRGRCRDLARTPG